MRGQNSVLRVLAMLVPLLMPLIFVSEAYAAWGSWNCQWTIINYPVSGGYLNARGCQQQ